MATTGESDVRASARSGTIFISYAHQDRAVADEIVAALQKLGLRPWLDRREIDPGDSFVARINQALARASYLLLLLSEAALASRWVSREWMAALAGESTVLVPLRLDDSPIPPILQDIQYIDFTSSRRQGLDALVRFLRREIEPISASRLWSSRTNLSSANRRQLRLVAKRCLSETDLSSFLFDAEIDPGSVGGPTFHDRLVCLLHLAAREGVLESFARWLATEKLRCVEHQLSLLQDEALWTLPRFT